MNMSEQELLMQSASHNLTRQLETVREKRGTLDGALFAAACIAAGRNYYLRAYGRHATFDALMQIADDLFLDQLPKGR